MKTWLGAAGLAAAKTWVGLAAAGLVSEAGPAWRVVAGVAGAAGAPVKPASAWAKASAPVPASAGGVGSSAGAAAARGPPAEDLETGAESAAACMLSLADLQEAEDGSACCAEELPTL